MVQTTKSNSTFNVSVLGAATVILAAPHRHETSRVINVNIGRCIGLFRVDDITNIVWHGHALYSSVIRGL